MKKFKPAKAAGLLFVKSGGVRTPSPFWEAVKALNPGDAIPVPKEMSARSARSYALVFARKHGIVLSCRMSVNGVYYVINMGKNKVAL